MKANKMVTKQYVEEFVNETGKESYTLSEYMEWLDLKHPEIKREEYLTVLMPYLDRQADFYKNLLLRQEARVKEIDNLQKQETELIDWEKKYQDEVLKGAMLDSYYKVMHRDMQYNGIKEDFKILDKLKFKYFLIGFVAGGFVVKMGIFLLNLYDGA